jgi:hypothetical protein
MRPTARSPPSQSPGAAPNQREPAHARERGKKGGRWGRREERWRWRHVVDAYRRVRRILGGNLTQEQGKGRDGREGTQGGEVDGKEKFRAF